MAGRGRRGTRERPIACGEDPYHGSGSSRCPLPACIGRSPRHPMAGRGRRGTRERPIACGEDPYHGSGSSRPGESPGATSGRDAHSASSRRDLPRAQRREEEMILGLEG